MHDAIDIGTRLELFTDRVLVEALDGAAFKLHVPRLEPPPVHPILGHYMTVFHDGSRYRAYYRQNDSAWQGEQADGNEGELTCTAESADGIEWTYPQLGLYEVAGSRRNNTVLRQAPFCHNFAPFLDANPAAAPESRYKALAGTHQRGERAGTGLHGFHSPDGIHWKQMRETAVLTHSDFAFDSQNVSFWSVAEGCYVCFFRTNKSSQGPLRTIWRTTSPDFVNWTPAQPTDPNLPGEHLYTSQTHPYFRAPHLYVALPTRFQPNRGSSTDILFMTARAGAVRFDRLFTEAFIRPGLDPERWGNRSNYAACGIVPTGPAEISIYHGPAGRRYTLRTDGFISIHAGYAAGRMTTRPFLFGGHSLELNVSTSAGGGVRVELQDEQGRPLPGRSFADCDEIVGDAISRTVTWKGSAAVHAPSGQAIRLNVDLKEADLYSIRFPPKPG